MILNELEDYINVFNSLIYTINLFRYLKLKNNFLILKQVIFNLKQDLIGRYFIILIIKNNNSTINIRAKNQVINKIFLDDYKIYNTCYSHILFYCLKFAI